MKVLHVASECFPLIKTGGLADVIGSLPFAQQRIGCEARLVLPYYPQVRKTLPDAFLVARRETFAGALTVRYAQYQGLGLYLLDKPSLYDRPGNPYHDENYYDYPDNVFRFALLGWAGAAIATGLDAYWGAADILHAHDWQAGLAAAYLTHWGSMVKSVFTIHNIAYQGRFAARHVPQVWLPWEMYDIEGVEFRGELCFLKSGLYYCDQITTVSPTYAEEITTSAAAAFGMQGLLRTRRAEGRLMGILNGVNETLWNPKSDPWIEAPYHPRAMQGKRRNKAALQRAFALPADTEKPLFVMVSRLTEQKGADLLITAMKDLLRKKEKPTVQLVLLGTGDPALEKAFAELAAAFPEHVASHLCYDEGLSHRVIAGGDAIVVPSRFEPCGLTQLYGLKYGTLPIVHRSGGLADTVTAANAATIRDRSATGFVFIEPSAKALAHAIRAALDCYRKPRRWAALRANAMRQEFGWSVAARRYQDCYRK